MFKKKSTDETVETEADEARKSVLKEKDDNYKFLLLVRDQNYEEAYKLGRAILKTAPNNPSIARFCQFIEQNNVQLKKMVDEEREEAEYTTDSEEQEEGDDEEDEEEEEGSEFSDSVLSQSQSEKSRSVSKEKKSRSPQRLCDVHEWPHVCKNENCPNKKPK